MLPDHLFVSEFDGALFDTRQADWHKSKPLRSPYNRHFGAIKTVAQFKATLRAGSSTDLGGYPLYFITDDGAALSFKAARECFRQIADSIATKASDGWRVVSCDINHEDAELYCDHTNEKIPSACGE